MQSAYPPTTGPAANITRVAAKKPSLSHWVLKVEEHFPGLISPFIQQINEAIHQKRVTHLQSADPTEKTCTFSQGLPSSGGDRPPI